MRSLPATHDRQEAEDLVQESHAKALKEFSSLQQDTNFHAVALVIAMGTVMSRLSCVRKTSGNGLRLQFQKG
jgi:DNA-directed RNA polymerase specialized sigma24 family protein